MEPKTVIKGAAKSKLVWLGVAITALGIVQTNLPSIEHAIPLGWSGFINIGIGIAVVALRAVTTTSLADKAEGVSDETDRT